MTETTHEEWMETYRASRYAFAGQGGWWEIALDGQEDGLPAWPVPVTLLTAWNPRSVERSRPWNEAANARLLRALTAAGLGWSAAWGASLPGVQPSWREEGFAVRGLDPAAAARWGRDWGQRAVVQLWAHGAGLIGCEDGEFQPCGVRLLRIPGKD